MHRLTSAVSSFSPSRRRFLEALGALGIALGGRDAGSAAANDAGSGDHGDANPLFVPGDRGYLGRLALQGKPLRLVADVAGPLPRGIVHGPIAYRAQHDNRDYINPTLIVRRGERVRIEIGNKLDAPTIVHWHGLSVDARNDGGGMNLIAPGENYTYDFEARNRASLYWYHPHPHGETARQMYGGLYGGLAIDDDDEDSLRTALDLAPGRSEIALTMQDRRNDPSYAPTAADLMHGFFGDALYVNGAVSPYLDVTSRVYRFRILNACNARTLRLALRGSESAQLPFFVIGNDGGLLPSPQRVDQAFLATAERLDILVDLRDAPAGEMLLLESLAFDPMHAETPGMTAHDHGRTWPEGA